MNWYSFVYRYYKAGYYTKDDVKVFVMAGKITPAQYQEITGDPYYTAAPEPEPTPEAQTEVTPEPGV